MIKKAPVAKSVPFDVTNLTSQSPDLTGLLETQEVVSALANRHFGKQFQRAETAGQITSSSTTFIDIQTLTTTSLPSGLYMIGAFAQFEQQNLNARLESRFFVNNTTALSLGFNSINDDDFDMHVSQFVFANLSGVNTIDWQLRRGNGSGSFFAINRNLFIYRVA